MADLMTDTYTYSNLMNQYGNFLVPAFKVKVNGNEILAQQGAFISGISVTLSLDYASCVVFQVEGAYDEASRTFSGAVKSTLSLGKIIEVELGYLSSMTTVFKGYIASVSVTVSGHPKIAVTAMDVRKLMMEAQNKVRYFDDENYSDMAAKIMNDYSSLCGLKQESSNDQLTKKIFQKNSDFEFISEVLAQKMNREFLVISDKAYFREADASAPEMMALEYGASLLSFTRQSDYLDVNVVTVGYDRSGQTQINSELAAKNEDLKNTVLSTPPNEIVALADAETTEDLAKVGEQIVRNKLKKVKTGYGTCIGLPQIVPGRYIKITKADDDVNGRYYVTEVKHSIGEQGFITEFKTEG